MNARRRMIVALLLAAVALAFAELVVASPFPNGTGSSTRRSSACPGCSTTYALAVAIAAIPVAMCTGACIRSISVLVGAAVFAAASIVAGAAGSLDVLLGARAAQGCGAALLLAGSLPVLVELVPGPGRGRRWWALAAAVGAAIGPALGGVLTEAFSWRAIFLVQAPIVAGALAVASDRSARAPTTRRAADADGEMRVHRGAATWRSPTSGSRSCSPRSSPRCSSACSWRSRCGGTARPSRRCW